MKFAYVFVAASLGMLAACSGLNEPDSEINPFLDKGDLVERVIFEAPVIRCWGEIGETRASLSQEEDEDIFFAWEATDTVGIYPNQGAQVYFSMENGVGTNKAVFDGGAWALRKGSTYSCYFPFVGNMYLNRDDIPVSFVNQEQTGLSNYEGIRFYLASEGTSSSSGSLQFSFEMLNTIIRVKAIGLPAGTYTKLSITADEPLFVEKGSFGLDDMEITGKTFSNSLDVSLKQFTLTEMSTETNPVFIYFTSAPIDLSGKTVTVRIYSDEDSIYKCEKSIPIPFEAKAWGGLRCDMERESAIFYTSSDNSIVTPKAEAFDATILSNEYVGSKGILVFDADVTQIGERAFENCTTLTGITIPESVTSIGDYAFSGCTNLGANDTPISMTQMFRAPSPFRSGETSIVIPDSVTSIGDYAFQNCTSLTSITIPNSVTSIGNGAFFGCENLSDIDIPTSVTDLGEKVFDGCTGLTSITIPEGVESIDAYAFAGCEHLISIDIPASVTSIGEHAFEYCENLVSITIPGGVEKIEDATFAVCKSLPSIVIPEGVTSIGESAFESCFALANVSLPNSVKTISNSAFASCTSLTSIVIPSQVTEIEGLTFWSCYSLESVTIPEGVTKIGFSAFDLCPSLTNITIPNSVTAIERRAFAESGLTGIIIPANVNSIAEWAFNGCTALTHITVHAVNTPADVTESTFSNTNDCLIYVPSGSLNAYKTAAGWSNYASRICDHVYVEMGNGMKWATTNVGAIGPDDYGDYFTWGGTEPVTPSSNITGGSFIDTANAIWGGNWRMPTPEEWEALLEEENYDWTWDYIRDGYKIVSKVPGYVGNTIFLPAAGTVGEEEIMGDGWDGYYWSSALHSESGEGCGLLFERSIESAYMGGYVLYGGCSVRPVYESNPNGSLEKPNDTGIEIEL